MNNMTNLSIDILHLMVLSELFGNNLNDVLPHAQNAAEAARGLELKINLEMHDYLFEHQKSLDDSHLLK